MAEKDQPVIPWSALNNNTQREKELRKKKRVRCFMYFFIFTLFKIGISLFFLLIVLKFRNPNFRVTGATFETFNYSAAAVNPSFNIRMQADLALKNRNFVKYKFEDSNVSFYYNGELVGSAFVPNSRVRLRSTEKWSTVVDLSSAGLANSQQLGIDLSSGVLTLNSLSKLKGEVGLLLLKKKKSADMDCVIAINLALKMVGDLRCK